MGPIWTRYGDNRLLLMFTGIVQEMGIVETVLETGLTVVASKTLTNLSEGDSISVNGACLTVTARDDRCFSVDLVPETIKRTNFAGLSEGDLVNLERALTVTDRFDGHIVQGHIDGIGMIQEISVDRDSLLIRVSAPPEIMRYVVEKGFIAVDGTSLTVVTCTREVFSFALIPYTRDNTVLGRRKVGDFLNLESDIIAKYVEGLLQTSSGKDILSENQLT